MHAPQRIVDAKASNERTSLMNAPPRAALCDTSGTLAREHKSVPQTVKGRQASLVARGKACAILKPAPTSASDQPDLQT